jgi:hypothetical protein
MALHARIRDGEGSNRTAGVTEEHAVKVALVEQSANSIPLEQLIRQKQLRTFLTNSSSSKDLNVDGSATPVEFSLEGEEGSTKWILRLRVLLNDVNMEIATNDFRRFGTATAASTPLTNGIEFFTEQSGVVTDFVAESVKTIGEFMNYASDFVNFVNSVGTQEDFLSFDFTFDVPIVLPAGAADRIVCRVNDDLTDVDLFQILAFGYQELDAS